MTVATLLSLVAKAWLALSIASLASLASAQDASVTPFDLTDYFTQSKMTLVITTAETAENAPYGSPYDVVPLTNEAGLQQTDVSKLPDVSGDLVILDYSNFTQVNYQDKIIFLCCDATTDNDTNLISPDRVLNTIMSNSVAPAAILLYSTTKSICVVGGSHLTYSRLWSMASQVDALKVHSVIATTNADTVLASIKPSSDSVESQQQQQPRPGGTSAIAMSILYSITGLITLLFLLIIGTGAVRAHRNPERYGPRASANGRPRRSRARGLAMAMLETLPIVKFGESDQRKPDEENALQAVAGTAPQAQDASQGVTEGSANVATSESSSEAASNAISQHEPESASVPTSSTPDKAKKEAEPEENPLGCSICTEDFTVGEDVRVLPCDHKFHPACVDPWLVNVSGTCPLCRLDLRPPEDIEREENGETAESQDATAAADGHLAPPAETNQTLESAVAGEETQRRRRSRLFDWNRLRHASVDERLQALRQYRQSQQSSDPASSAADDERRHSRLTDRIRGRFHLRGDSRSSAATPGDSLPPTSTAQQ